MALSQTEVDVAELENVNGGTISEKIKRFFKKYFWYGQLLSHEIEIDDDVETSWVKFEKRILFRDRRYFENTKSPFIRLCAELGRFLLAREFYRSITYCGNLGFLGPVLLWQFIWWSLAIRHNFFAIFAEKWKMSVTMIFGGLVAGGTTEGGGAVAFPIMTLILHVKPDVARDFSMMIQATGMTAASLGILYMKIHIEWHAVAYCISGGVAGLLIGLHFVEQHISPAWKKMMFVSIWFAFAVALFILNRKKKRITHPKILRFSWPQMALLLVIGFLGGIITSFSGSGVDICSFSFLTLLFLVSEKVATPTSVLLMASTSLVGVFWRQFILGGISREAWEYLAVTAPIVGIQAPLGALISSHLHRQVLASFVYILEAIVLITAFIVVKPGGVLIAASIAVMVGGSAFFFFLSILGQRLYGDLESLKCTNVLSAFKRQTPIQTQKERDDYDLRR